MAFRRQEQGPLDERVVGAFVVGVARTATQLHAVHRVRQLPIRPITTAVDANRSQRQPQDLALRPGQAVRRPDELIDVAGVQGSRA